MRRRFINSNQTFDYSNYMTIEALEDGYEVYFERDVEYNLNGNKWMILKAGFLSPNLKKGDLLSLRCSLTPSEEFGQFHSNGKAINLRGNILSLIFKDDIKLDISHYCNVFIHTFFDENIVSIEKNFLPATTLAEGCYRLMFSHCTSLTTAPELPATTLASTCYYDMFQDCYSLTSAPELPATTLAYSCYAHMFQDCYSLTSAPELPATTLAYSCYAHMFQDCTGLTSASELPATTLVDDCYYHMFAGCTGLTSAPELPATTLVNRCYESMFQNCSSLTSAPTLPAITLAYYCYSDMFKGCSKLNYIKMLATDISATRCLNTWVYGVASTGTFVKNPAMTSLPTAKLSNDYAGIPSGWTVVNDGED